MNKGYKKEIEKFQEAIGIKLKNIKFLELAFTHKSYINENKKSEDNERLEFLGDAVLELVCTEFLYRNFPEKKEGEMTAIRSALVKKESLCEAAKKLNIGKLIKLSRGEKASGGQEKDYILANTVEAIIGAIFLDQGMKQAQAFVKKNLLNKTKQIIKQKLHIDAKSLFQEIAQEKKKTTPSYKVLNEKGPDHSKVFTSGIFLEEKLVAKGKGSSKQNSEVDAAKNGLKVMKWS